MRILVAILLFASAAFGQGTAAPPQGPPPKNLTKLPDGHFSANKDAANPENFELHVVVAGETLSGIAQEVLKDYKLWPQLWEQNDHIINPHWIYPNDKILIRPITRISQATPPPAPDQTPPAQAAPAPLPPPAPARLAVQPAVAPPPPAPPRTVLNMAPPRNFPEVKTSDLYCSGFIRTTDVPHDMKVVARFNSDRSVLAAEGDYIYVGKGLEDGVRVGSAYQVIRPTKKIDNPSRKPTERNMGMHYLDVAQIRVVLAQSDFALARVVQNCEAVEIGDIMVPFERIQFPALPLRRPFSPTMKASGQIRGSVVTTKNALANFGSAFRYSTKIPGVQQGTLASMSRGVAGEGAIVYVDIGKGDGVKAGDFFIVYRDVDVDDGVLAIDRKKVEKQKTAIGEIVILKVDDKASTALVTYSADAISLGDAVERR